MIKRLVVILSLLSQLSFSAPELRHTQGFQGWEAAAGITSMGPLLSVAYSRYLARAWYWKGGLSARNHTRAGVCYHHLSLCPTLCRSIWQPLGCCYVNLPGAILLTYEGHKHRAQARHHFNIALSAGIELELFLTNRLALLLSFAPHYYFLPNPYRHWGYEGRLGIKATF